MTMKPLGLSLSGNFSPSPERIRSDLLRRRRELYGLPDVVGALVIYADSLHLVELGIVPRSVFDEYFWPAFHIVHADALALLDVQAINGTSARPPMGIAPVEETPLVSAASLIYLAVTNLTEDHQKDGDRNV